MKFKFLSIIFSIITITAFAQTRLQNGTWRGVLATQSGAEIPFNFEVKDTAGHQQVSIINGSEHFKVNDVKTKGDSVIITMPLFDSEFRLKAEAGSLKGNWIKHLGERDVATPFSAQYGVAYRFKPSPQSNYNVNGRWSAYFGTDHPDTTVAEFKQTGTKVTGTFLTTTGDYRFLEGAVDGSKLYLSCFDGGHAFLFTADIQDGQTLTNGQFFSGLTGKDTWTAVKNPNAKLPDAYSLTALKPGYTKLDFSFPDLDGKKVSLSDSRFKNKVVVIEMMGSWCPNCMDETGYLVNFYKKFHKRGVEVLGLAYERTTDFNKSKASLLKEKQHFNVPYPFLITGFTNNKREPAKSLPALNNFLAFPTTIIIDKKGNVRKIYTGFSGPGTGNYYTEFVSQFEKITEDLLAEK
ncbi:TlpA family protein disulfide reductase [Mucilaginibacter sp. RS28]|uniref:TlpA family protein disulfide reductase n=1 Tax=Mucilaginibacter straminoryzae TaxID=2932774 RepID=A0A9X1X1G6_9SPHI|nr:TlpA disulfide reductase family protein [Mucilaginibacter straminoryzae]MCJ8208270.1 TlpA family protein disulfide reductase [Mucilaginibacter straminoryzae]